MLYAVGITPNDWIIAKNSPGLRPRACQILDISLFSSSFCRCSFDFSIDHFLDVVFRRLGPWISNPIVFQY